jgi:DNA replication protein DnaC
MFEHPTLDKLAALKLTGMVEALQEQRQMGAYDELSFEERLGMLVDREATRRQNRLTVGRLKRAALRQEACVEDINFRYERSLDRSQMLSLATCQWVRNRRNCLITGPTGVGKSYIACALAQKAIREGCTARYERLSRLLADLVTARHDGTYYSKLGVLAQTDLLILDDWGVTPLTDDNRRDLLELFDDRYNRRSTLVTSQIPVKQWHEYIANPTLADAILDRLVHNAHQVALTGPSIRGNEANLIIAEEQVNHNVTIKPGGSHASKS